MGFLSVFSGCLLGTDLRAHGINIGFSVSIHSKRCCRNNEAADVDDVYTGELEEIVNDGVWVVVMIVINS